MKPTLIVAAMLLSAGPAMAAEKLYWGPHGEHYATVVSKSGIDTDHAKIRLRYQAKFKAVRPKLHPMIAANCSTGRFSSYFSGQDQFTTDKNALDHFVIINSKGEEVPNVAYWNTFEAFKALCPARVHQ